MRKPGDVHPLLEHTPTNHFIQVIDAPIREYFYYLLFEMPDEAFLNDVRAGRKVYFLCLNDTWTFHTYDKKNKKTLNFIFSNNSENHAQIKKIEAIAKKYQSKNQSKKIGAQDADDKSSLESVAAWLNRDTNYVITKEEESPKESVRILVCNTQHPHSFKDGKELENKATYLARFGQLIDIIKKVEQGDETTDNAANPDIYTFLAVHPMMKDLIEKHFNSKKYHIISQTYGENVVKAYLITIIKKSVVKNTDILVSGLYQMRVQSLLCTLANTKKQFVLHLAHLPHRGNNVDQATHIDQTERGIINTIFSNAAFASYPQILTGDLNITLVGKNKPNDIKNIATSIAPTHRINNESTGFNGEPIPCWDRTMGTLTIPALQPSKTSTPVQLSFYQAIQKIELGWHEAIDPKTGSIHRPTKRIMSSETNTFRLLSRFGSTYQRLLSKQSNAARQDMKENKYHQKALHQELNGVQLYISINQNNIISNCIYHISKKIWPKLKLLLDWDKLNKVLDKNSPQHEHLTGIFLILRKSYENEIPEAIARLYSEEYQNALTLEEAVKEHCSCQWIKENDVIYIQLSFKERGQLLAQYFNYKFGLQGAKIIGGDKIRLPIEKVSQDMGSALEWFFIVARNVEDINNKCSGLTRISFYPRTLNEAASISIIFYNEEIKKLIEPLFKNSFDTNLELLSSNFGIKIYKIPHENFFYVDGHRRKPSLSRILVDKITEVLKVAPYGMKLSQTTKDAVVSKKALPHTLTQRFELTQGKAIEGSFSYTLAARTSYAYMAFTFYKDTTELWRGIFSEFKNYSGENDVYLESKSIVTQMKTDSDPIAQATSLQKHCQEKINQSRRDLNSMLWSAPKIDKHTNLLHNSLINDNFLANLEFNYPAEFRIQTLQQLINTQEKRELYDLCVKERERDGGEPYNKIRKNSALLLLEQHLILSHPEYTANDVWEHIKAKPVEHYGTGKNYPHESDDRALTLGEMLTSVKKIWDSLSSLVTSNDVATHANEVLNK